MPELTGKVYTVAELARRLRVDESTVRKWCSGGVLKQGIDFFILPKMGERNIYRFTQEQYDRLVGNPPQE